MRATSRRSRRPPPRAASAKVARRLEQLADLPQFLAVRAVRLLGRVEREPSAPKASGWREEKRHRHREVLVDARLGERLSRMSEPCGCDGSSGSSPPRSGSRCRRTCRAAAVVEARGAGDARARAEASRAAGRRVVRGVDDLLRRHEPQQPSRSIALQTEVSKKTPRLPAKRCARLARSAMPAWARISCAPGCASTRRSSSAAIGGRPRPAWIRIGTPRSAASSKTGASRSSLSRNFCARGWSLIPRAPRSRQRGPPRSAPRRARAARTG